MAEYFEFGDEGIGAILLAEFLKAKDLGTIEKTKWADLVVLSKNPLDDIKNSRTIEAVYIAGNRVK